MITDPDEFVALENFYTTGITTADTLNIWRKKDNGIIKLITDFGANSVSNPTISVDLLAATISIKPASIGASLLIDGSVTGAKISNLTITEGKLADGSVTTAKISDAQISTAKLIDGSVTTAKIAVNGITTARIADAQISTAKLIDGSVTTIKIGDSQITNAKIATNAITAAKIGDGEITAAKIGAAAVTAAKIEASAVSNSKINDGAVTTSKILDLSVTGDKIGGANVPRQILYDIQTTTQSVAPGSWVDLGLTKSITVKDGCRVRIQATIYGATAENDHPIAIRIFRSGAIGVPADASSRISAGGTIASTTGVNNIGCGVIDFFEALSSGTYTYKIQARVRAGTTGFINRSAGDADSTSSYRVVSTLALTELS